MYENILAWFLLTVLSFGAVILMSWVCVYAILDIVSRLKKFKNGDNWRINI